jgi:hypothetical protein
MCRLTGSRLLSGAQTCDADRHQHGDIRHASDGIARLATVLLSCFPEKLYH